MIRYCLHDTGGSRSIPADDPIRAGASADGAEIALVIGREAGRHGAGLAPSDYRAVLVELDGECLGVHGGEDFGREGGNRLGFARFRLGDAPPSRLVEIVVQPATTEDARVAATALFEAAGLSVAVCRDTPGRIVDRLIRPYFNQALQALDEGLAEPDVLDRTLRLGLGYPRGPVELLRDSGLHHHGAVTAALHAALGQAPYHPARRAQVAASRARRAPGS